MKTIIILFATLFISMPLMAVDEIEIKSDPLPVYIMIFFFHIQGHFLTLKHKGSPCLNI